MKRLGLDIGTNSIGWCLIEDDGEGPSRIVDIGVRIFSDGRDPKSGASLAVDRRAARAMRRRRDRYLGRRAAFLKALKRFGLMPADESAAKLLADRDPYELRARALDERLEPHEIGRALFHLNQRRGFKSNRKAERKTKDAEDGKIASGAKALDQAMAESGAETLGQFLAGRDTKRVRMGSDAQGYDFYPQRRHVEYEFDTIWARQQPHHPALLTDEARDALKRILFFQRPLKEQEVGVCTFVHSERRLPKAHPLFQERRLYEEVNQLEITTPGAPNRKLTREQRDHLILILRDKKEVSFKTLAGGKGLKLQPGQSFNKASETRTGLKGDEVYALLADKKRFGDRWPHLDGDRQWTIIKRLIDEEDPDTLHAFLTCECGLTGEEADATARVQLPEGYGRLGPTATRRILDELKREVITISGAEEIAFGRRGERERAGVSELPYYGQILTKEIPPGTFDPSDQGNPERYFGKITNPTVHVALRQLEKLVNAITQVHGRPDQIVVELARELKLNEEQRKGRTEENRRNREAVIKRGEKLEELGQKNTGANRALLRVWEELSPNSFLDRACPYCGEMVSPTMLFDGRAQVDHIIPFSLSLDDSAANKVVVHRGCNQAKGNRTPWQAFHTDPSRWAAITAQVSLLPKRKQWRFGPDALDKLQEQGGFEARQLTDTQYTSKLAGTYLSHIYSSDEGRRVYVIPGRMTAMLRGLWGLNNVLLPDGALKPSNLAEKNRNDHRHHAIDAFVIAMTTHSLLNAIAHAAAQAEQAGLERLLEQVPEPWPGFRTELREKLTRVTVSHKPDHGRKGVPAKNRDVTAGRLHNDTAYGLTGDVAADGKTPIVVHRVPLSSIKPADISDPDRIPDPELRAALHRATDGLSGKSYEAALANFSKAYPQFAGIRRVRVREPLNVIPIRDGNGRAYKAYKGDANARFDVWQLPTGRWTSDIVSMFDAHGRDGKDRRPHPAAKKVLSLRQNDMLAIERNGSAPEIVRVVKFSGNGQIALAGHNEGGALKARDAASNDADPFKYVLSSAGGLKNLRARQVRIDPLGRIFDPGPR